MLKIGDSYIFKDDWSDRQSSLIYFEEDEDEPAAWSIDIGFTKGDFNGTKISPSICINSINTTKKSIAELIGESFSVTTAAESYDREDSFYIYEHEPLVSYELKILEIKDDTAHIMCKGILIVDGYAKPPATEKFEIDSWLPIIKSVNDWEKFGL